MADVDPIAAPSVEAPAPEPELSIADHEAQFHDSPTPPAEADPLETDAPPRRDRDEAGKFAKAPRHRAVRQQASPQDVPRIAELTRKLRETEAERDALKTRPAPGLEPSAPPSAGDPVAGRVSPSPPTSPRGPASEPAAKPKLDDFQEYGEYVEAIADWKIAEARRQDQETRIRDTAAHQLAESWRTRVADAQAKYPDFEQVALRAPTTIPQGSLVDAWILEHRSGADVLYSLQKDPAELARILALPLFDQVDALSLLAQRLGQPAREPAVKTGAAATVSPRPAPRPPTPVRSSAMPAADEPPGDDASLAAFEKFYYRDRQR